MADKLVYSSDSGRVKQDGKKKQQGFNQPGPVRTRIEKKGRGGKLVTVVYNLPFSKQEAKQLMKKFQAQYGCGATLKEGTIELRGDWSQQFEEFAKKSPS